MTDDLIKKAMSELGKKSAEARRKKDPKYWEQIRLKGAAARKKITHEVKPGVEVTHSAKENCGINCPVSEPLNTKSERLSKQPQKKGDMPFSLD